MDKPYFIECEVRTNERTVLKDETISGRAEEFTAISFENIGTANATINGRPLNPGSGILAYELEVPHLDISDYSIVFTGVGSKQVFVSMKKVVKTTAVLISKICPPKK